MKRLNLSYGEHISSFITTVKNSLVGLRPVRCLAVCIVLMGILITFGNRGLVDSYVMREKLGALQKSSHDMVVENRDLRKSIVLLRNDLNYIEAVARNELGMVRAGDMVYRYAQ